LIQLKIIINIWDIITKWTFELTQLTDNSTIGVMLDGMLEFSFTHYMNRELRFSIMMIVTSRETTSTKN